MSDPTKQNQTDHPRGPRAPDYITYLPSMALAAIVAAVFLVAIFTYQVPETEFVVVTTLDRVDQNMPKPGLNFKWPYPIQKIHRFDKRARCFTGNEGKIEETYTADGENVILSLFTVYRVGDPARFFINVKDIENAEARLNTLLRNAKLYVIGRHPFSSLVNTDPSELKLPEIENEILDMVRRGAAEYGLEIDTVGIRFLGLPESVNKKVFDRMREERNKLAIRYLEQGNKIAEEIRADADREKSLTLAEADRDAKEIRGEGDAAAAKAYAVFKQNPELAAFLQKLNALKNVLDAKTTIILDTRTPPFDLLGEEFRNMTGGKQNHDSGNKP